MKIAVTAKGRDRTAPVDPRFGRAEAFVVCDTESDTTEAVDNTQNLNAAQGAGIQAAQAVSELGVTGLITGHCGPKAFRALNAAGIEVYTGAEGTVQDALGQLERGELQKADSADVSGHWI